MKIVTTFELESETKAALHYHNSSSSADVFGAIYLHKSAFGSAKPQAISLTIEAKQLK